MKKLDYLYGEDRQMSFRTFDIHLLSYEEMKQYRIDYSYYYNQATEAVIAINNQNTLKMKKQAYGGLFDELE
jgi:hypothetical protein